EPILGAYPAADLGQGVGLVRQFGGLEQIAFLNQLQPVGDEIVDRALPLAIGIAACQAAMGLVPDLLLPIRLIDFDKLALTNIDGFLVRILAADIEKLKMIVQTLFHSLSPCLIPDAV